jgi:hypothetical protein
LVDIEALVFRPEFFSRAQVPFAGKKRGMTRFLESFRQSDLGKGHAIISSVDERTQKPSIRVGMEGLSVKWRFQD